MKKISKALSVILAVLMLSGCFMCLAGADTEKYRDDLPTIYLRGQGFTLYDKDGNKIYPITFEDGYIGDAAKSLINPLMKGMTLNKWDEWLARVAEITDETYGVVALDKNGEVSDGSGPAKNYVTNRKHSDGLYDIGSDYVLSYDWRLDPCDSAVVLHDYIAEVKSVTGAQKVNLVGRCIGSNVVLAYMSMYDTSDIDKIVLISNGFDGFDIAGALYTGTVEFDAEKLKYFAEDYFRDTTDPEAKETYDTLIDMLYVMDATASLGITVGMVEAAYKRVSDQAIPQIGLGTFASMPSYWSLVGDEYYEAAKAYMFGDQIDEYAGMIEKIDNFHYNVMMKYGEIISKSIAEGSDVHIVSKYGYQFLPITEDKTVQSDGLLETSSSSFGATTAPVDSTFDSDYIAAAIENGTDKYISPDNIVDASTCFLADHTWFVKNSKHLDNPTSFNYILRELLNDEGYTTVFGSDTLTQYMTYDAASDSIVLSVEDSAVRNTSFFSRYFSFLRRVFALIKKLLGR